MNDWSGGCPALLAPGSVLVRLLIVEATALRLGDIFNAARQRLILRAVIAFPILAVALSTVLASLEAFDQGSVAYVAILDLFDQVLQLLVVVLVAAEHTLVQLLLLVSAYLRLPLLHSGLLDGELVVLELSLPLGGSLQAKLRPRQVAVR